MKAVLISINPRWCELIASGTKTVEVRKTRPKLETPFKVYIYCTKGKFEPHEHLRNNLHYDDSTIKVCEGQGKIIGEFVCDKVESIEIRHFTVFGHENRYTAVGENPDYQWLKKSCLSYDEVAHYGKFAPLYGWHISDLVIYDKPRELSEFKQVRKIRGYHKKDEPKTEGINIQALLHSSRVEVKYFTRPPQSWCYVEVQE